MLRPKLKKQPKRRRVKFSIEAPEAQNVSLMGEFNAWNPKKHPMQNSGNGRWEKALLLPPGNYQYKFLVDGQWRGDLQNEQTCLNSYGTYNNIISVASR